MESYQIPYIERYMTPYMILNIQSIYNFIYDLIYISIYEVRYDIKTNFSGWLWKKTEVKQIFVRYCVA